MLRKASARAQTLSSILAAFSLSSTPLTAQDKYWKNQATIGAGLAVPGGDTSAYMSSSFLLRLNYAYRFHKNLQAEVGLDSILGGAGVNKVAPTPFGNVRVYDCEYFYPFGARVILPLFHNRFEFSGGGGGAYMQYSEEIKPAEDSAATCPYGGCGCVTCKLRAGWGYYSVAGAAFSLDHRRRFWLGVNGRYVPGNHLRTVLGHRA